jgi:hypothetical protein
MKIGCQYMRAEYSLFSEEFAIKTAINGNGCNERNSGMFPFIISAFSVFSVAMIANRYERRNNRATPLSPQSPYVLLMC